MDEVNSNQATRIPESVLSLLAMYGFILGLNILGWGLFASHAHLYGAAYAGAGTLAFTLGMRHAFDADHISAIDDTTRYLLQRGKKTNSVGFFFSLGHSTVVASLAFSVAIGAHAVQHDLPTLQRIGGTVGATISGTFLLAISVLDFLILRGIIDVWRKTKAGQYSAEELDELMTQRGFINRIFGGRWRRFINHSWQMYPVGLLFGLGFDTASEIGLLALTAAAATGTAGHHGLPFAAIIALPILFAAGMTLMDTTDGVLMARAYAWSFHRPIRKVYYNMATVALGIFVASFIGLVEYLQVLSEHAHFNGAFWDWLNRLNFERLGYFIVAIFFVLWIGSFLLYKLRRIEERYG